MPRSLGLNKHQKAAFKVGERRAGRAQIAELLEKAASDDPDARCEAAENLCPCHVRRRIEAVWDALYRMLEDDDVRVRRAAWHTLEDGGRPDDPALDAVLERVAAAETDPFVRRMIAQVGGARNEKEIHTLRAKGLARPARGKCDFCGREPVPIERDPGVEIPAGDHYRPAWICGDCRKKA